MFKIQGEEYYIDIDAITEKCHVQSKKTSDEETDDDDDEPVIEINVFKFDILKMCIDRLFAEFDDDNDDKLFKKSTSLAFDLAFNTLRKFDIIKINDNEDE